MTAIAWPIPGLSQPDAAELRRQALADVYELLIAAGRARRAAREAQAQQPQPDTTSENGK